MRHLLFISLLWVSTALALPAETWVVAIGNNTGKPGELGLLYAEHDAVVLTEALRLHGGVSSTHIRTVMGVDAAKVRQALLDVNVLLRERVQAGTPSALVVFFSGHADAAALHLGDTDLPLDELKSLVEGSSAEVRLLIVDACRSGALTRVKGVKPAPTFDLELRSDVATHGMAIMTSSASGESSQESDALGGSYFTHHLVNALRGAADVDGDGRVTLTEAYGYTYAQTLRSTGETAALQHATYAFDVKGRGDLVLSIPAANQGQLARLRLAGDAVHLITRERAGGALVAEVQPLGERRELVLPAQRYFVQERRRTEYREYEVELAQGERVDLAQVPFRSVKYDRLVRQRGDASAFVQHLALVAGARSEVLKGAGAAPQLSLGYGFDLPWGSVGLRLRGLVDTSQNADSSLEREDSEVSLGALLSKSFDLTWLNLAIGLCVEGVVLSQRFGSNRMAPARTALGLAFSGVFSAEFPLPGGFSIRAEAGPLALLYPRAAVDEVGRERRETGSAFSFQGNGGVVWRF